MKDCSEGTGTMNRGLAYNTKKKITINMLTCLPFLSSV